MTQISGLVITLNEAHNLVDCLRSMKTVCDDIVVVDSGSSDGTVELARQEGATVIVQVPFLGDGPQRSHGLPHCRHAWHAVSRTGHRRHGGNGGSAGPRESHRHVNAAQAPRQYAWLRL